MQKQLKRVGSFTWSGEASLFSSIENSEVQKFLLKSENTLLSLKKHPRTDTQEWESSQLASAYTKYEEWHKYAGLHIEIYHE